jgi:hypothetical protein
MGAATVFSRIGPKLRQLSVDERTAPKIKTLRAPSAGVAERMLCKMDWEGRPWEIEKTLVKGIYPPWYRGDPS